MNYLILQLLSKSRRYHHLNRGHDQDIRIGYVERNKLKNEQVGTVAE